MPLRGISAIDKDNQPFHLPEADRALFEALRQNVRAPVELVELDLHINDPAFAAAMAERLLQMLKDKEEKQHEQEDKLRALKEFIITSSRIDDDAKAKKKRISVSYI